MGDQEHREQYQPIPSVKYCPKCQLEKPFLDFNQDKTHKFGLASKCKACAAKAASDWYYANKGRALAHGARRYAENTDACRNAQALWREKNKDKKSAGDRLYRLANKELVAFHKGSRKHAARTQSRSFDSDLMRLVFREAYDLASRRKALSGNDWHVDHIVPLKSKIVCGLHNEFNIQVIPAIQNLRKSNRFWPQMP